MYVRSCASLCCTSSFHTCFVWFADKFFYNLFAVMTMILMAAAAPMIGAISGIAYVVVKSGRTLHTDTPARTRLSLLVCLIAPWFVCAVLTTMATPFAEMARICSGRGGHTRRALDAAKLVRSFLGSLHLVERRAYCFAGSLVVRVCRRTSARWRSSWEPVQQAVPVRSTLRLPAQHTPARRWRDVPTPTSQSLFFVLLREC